MTRGRIAVAATGAGLAAGALTGRAELLVRPWFIPMLLAAGILLVLAATRGSVHLSRTNAALLLAPVAIGVAVTPAVAGRVSGSSADLSTLSQRIGDPANPLIAGRGGKVTLLQILFAEQRVGGVALAGRPVTVEAIATGPHRLSRTVIVCCAADAQSVSISETGVTLPGNRAWVRVSGHLTTSGNHTVLAATRVQPIPAPADPFL